MFSQLVDQGIAVVIYVILVSSMAYGRPPRPARVGPGSAPAGESGGLRFDPTELLWIAALAITALYPLGVLLFSENLRRFPFAVTFGGDEAFQIAGLVLVAAAGFLLATAFRALGRFATVRIEVSEEHRVVQSGPYAVIRHPMYTANILWTAGIALAFLSTFLWVPVAAIVLLARMRARREEQLFLRSPRLGGEYEAYFRSTGRFLPKGRRPSMGPPVDPGPPRNEVR